MASGTLGATLPSGGWFALVSVSAQSRAAMGHDVFMRDKRFYWSWARRIERREAHAASMWTVPTGCAVAAIILQSLIIAIPASVAEQIVDADDPLISYSNSAAVAVLSAVAGSMMTVTGIVFSVMTLTVQQAGSAISPRVVRTFYRDPVVKWSFGIFVGTFTYAVLLISEIDSPAAPLGMFVGLLLVMLAVGTFLYMVNHVGQTLRSASMLARVSGATFQSIVRAYPVLTKNQPEPEPTVPNPHEGYLVCHTGRAGMVMAVNVKRLDRVARKRKLGTRLLVKVGDPIGPGDPLLSCDREPPRMITRLVVNQIAIGEERAIDFDPSFGVRILVDTASKALSPGVNDPTTATIALDNLAEVLFCFGSRRLQSPTSSWLSVPALSWPGLLELALREITYYGSASFQVTRRLAALMDRLHQLPKERHDAIKPHQAELERRVRASYQDEEDIDFALTPDPQGISAIRRQHYSENG